MLSFCNNVRSALLKNKITDIRIATRLFCEATEENPDGGEQQKAIDPAKDRRNPVPVETSMRYLMSKAYKETYGEKPVWFQYRRNHKGGFAPRKTRKTCVRNGIISTGNPCPICRDEYLILDHRNIDLLQQFISEHTRQILGSFETGLCQKKHKELLVAIEKAYDCGLLTFDVPFRIYDYSLYNKPGNANLP